MDDSDAMTSNAVIEDPAELWMLLVIEPSRQTRWLSPDGHDKAFFVTTDEASAKDLAASEQKQFMDDGISIQAVKVK